ncbi:MAG: prenyltransferase/squalene oxidase repeat-containing protein [bacterium]
MTFESHVSELATPDAAAFLTLAERLRARPEREPAADLADRIMAALDAERAREQRRFRVPSPWWGAAAAAGLIAAVSLFDLADRSRSAQTSVPQADGYAWLASSQEADGTWSPAKHGGAEAYRPALTALSALALARAPRPYAPQLQRACSALAAFQTADGAFGGEGRAQLYNHAITTYALASLNRGYPSLKPVLERALDFIRSRQTAEGGWDYDPRSEGNAALTAWQVRALACAEAQGFDRAKEPLRKGLRWLRGSLRDDGSIAYHRSSLARSDSLTALAAYTLITAGKDFPGLPELGRQATRSLGVPSETDRSSDCYRDYAKALAYDSAGAVGQAAAVRRQMLKHQELGCRDQWEPVGGKLYTTALTMLAAKP